MRTTLLRSSQAGYAESLSDGRRIVTTEGANAYIYLVHIQDLIALAKSHASRELTPEERETFLRVEGDEMLLPNP